MKRLIAGAVVVLPCASALAITPSVDYRCLAMAADNIVVVNDARTDRPVMTDYFGPLFLTRLDVEKQFKGVLVIAREPSEQFEVIVRRDDRNSAGFRLAKEPRSLVFIKNTDQGPAILGDAPGVLPYSDGITIYDVKLDDAAIKTFFSDKSLAKAKCPDL